MVPTASPPGRRSRRRRLRESLLTASCIAMVGAAILGRLASPPTPDVAAPAPDRAPEAVRASVEPAPLPERHAWMLDPKPALGSTTPGLDAAPLTSRFVPAAPQTTLAAAIAPVETVTPKAAEKTVPEARFVQTVPLPMRRPADLRTAPETVRLAERPVSPRAAGAGRLQTANADPEAERSFFDTVFGAKPSTGPQLAYAPLDTDAIPQSPRRALGPGPSAESGTAVYNISARTVTLPSGEHLEAHSGLGSAQDDPRYVHLRMRGATPPGTYDLKLREAMFHGVQAIRLTPVGGSAAIHGRDGILAHTYMLGPSGASNGCVVFRNYNRFLQAYMRGEVRRIVVVAGNGSDAFPSFANGLFGRSAKAD